MGTRCKTHRNTLPICIPSGLLPSHWSGVETVTTPKSPAGDSRFVAEFDPYHGCTLAELSYAYPLKLLSPRTKEGPVTTVYVLSFGGGLVGGDKVGFEVGILEGLR